jgi:hypothetical protein
MNYSISVKNTGGQGASGNSVSSAYVSANNHLFVVVSDGAGNVVEEIDAGDVSANISLGVDDLSDVSINFLGNDYFLGYNSSANRWESKLASLSGLSDTTISGVVDNDLLVWNGTTSKFTNQTPSEAGFANVATSGNYSDLSGLPNFDGSAPSNAAITLASAGTGFTGGGTFYLNQLGNATVTYSFDQTALVITESQIVNLQNYITDYTVTQSDVTTHQASLAITEAQITNLQAYLTAEADTLATVMARGATTSAVMTITNASASNTTASGALVVTGGVGIGGKLNVGGNTIISGNLTVNGTTTTVNSNEVNIGDAVILLNSDEAGIPSQNAGFEIERGTSANVAFLWDESVDSWDMGGYELKNVVLDGGTY